MTTTDTTPRQDQIVYRDPNVLVANPANVRTDLGKVTDLAQSIAQVGVLEPIILVPTKDGGEAILAGHRRTRAAIEAGVTAVPCILRPDLASGEDSITAMLVENLRRKDLSRTETARGYEQLVGFGLSASAIAKRTGSRAKDVKDHLVIAGSELAAKAGERFEFLTMSQLLILAEFEDDHDAVRELMLKTKEDPDYLEHRASQLRQAKVFQAKLAETTAQLIEAGVAIVDEPKWSDHGPMRRLDQVVNADGKDISVRQHAKCEGHVATLSSYDPEKVTYWCTEPTRYGHQDRWGRSDNAASSSARDADGKLTEEARTERRRIIANNKAMDAANPVRREFVVGLLARKSAPKGALRFAVRDLAQHAPDMSGTEAFLAGFLGVTSERSGYERTTGIHAVDQAGDARLVHVLLAHMASAIESTWTKEAWRSVDQRKAAWLSFLATQGYRLAEVEQLVVDEAAAKAEQRHAVLTEPHDDDPSEDELDGDDLDLDD